MSTLNSALHSHVSWNPAISKTPSCKVMSALVFGADVPFGDSENYLFLLHKKVGVQPSYPKKFLLISNISVLSLVSYRVCLDVWELLDMSAGYQGFHFSCLVTPISFIFYHSNRDLQNQSILVCILFCEPNHCFTHGTSWVVRVSGRSGEERECARFAGRGQHDTETFKQALSHAHIYLYVQTDMHNL